MDAEQRFWKRQVWKRQVTRLGFVGVPHHSTPDNSECKIPENGIPENTRINNLQDTVQHPHPSWMFVAVRIVSTVVIGFFMLAVFSFIGWIYGVYQNRNFRGQPKKGVEWETAPWKRALNKAHLKQGSVDRKGIR